MLSPVLQTCEGVPCACRTTLYLWLRWGRLTLLLLLLLLAKQGSMLLLMLLLLQLLRGLLGLLQGMASRGLLVCPQSRWPCAQVEATIGLAHH